MGEPTGYIRTGMGVEPGRQCQPGAWGREWDRPEAESGMFRKDFIFIRSSLGSHCPLT